MDVENFTILDNDFLNGVFWMPKVQAFLEDAMEFGRNFEDTRGSCMCGGYQDRYVSSHFGFCDDGEFEVVVSPQLEKAFVMEV